MHEFNNNNNNNNYSECISESEKKEEATFSKKTVLLKIKSDVPVDNEPDFSETGAVVMRDENTEKLYIFVKHWFFGNSYLVRQVDGYISDESIITVNLRGDLLLLNEEKMKHYSPVFTVELVDCSIYEFSKK